MRSTTAPLALAVVILSCSTVAVAAAESWVPTHYVQECDQEGSQEIWDADTPLMQMVLAPCFSLMDNFMIDAYSKRFIEGKQIYSLTTYKEDCVTEDDTMPAGMVVYNYTCNECKMYDNGFGMLVCEDENAPKEEDENAPKEEEEEPAKEGTSPYLLRATVLLLGLDESTSVDELKMALSYLGPDNDPATVEIISKTRPRRNLLEESILVEFTLSLYSKADETQAWTSLHDNDAVLELVKKTLPAVTRVTVWEVSRFTSEGSVPREEPSCTDTCSAAPTNCDELTAAEEGCASSCTGPEFNALATELGLGDCLDEVEEVEDGSPAAASATLFGLAAVCLAA